MEPETQDPEPISQVRPWTQDPIFLSGDAGPEIRDPKVGFQKIFLAFSEAWRL